jgi:hypothetical protein
MEHRVQPRTSRICLVYMQVLGLGLAAVSVMEWGSKLGPEWGWELATGKAL